MKIFKKWVDNYGGTKRLAKKLGTTEAAVYHWLSGKGWPKVDTIRDIIKISKNELTFSDIVGPARPSMRRK